MELCALTRAEHEWVSKNTRILCRRCWLEPDDPDSVKLLFVSMTSLKTRTRHKSTMRVRALPTSIILHSVEQSDRFDSMVTVEADGHHLFHPQQRGHFRCETTLGTKEISALRFAYSRAHPDQTVEENYNVRPKCGVIGALTSGDGMLAGEGYCVNPEHLILERVC